MVITIGIQLEMSKKLNFRTHFIVGLIKMVVLIAGVTIPMLPTIVLIRQRINTTL